MNGKGKVNVRGLYFPDRYYLLSNQLLFHKEPIYFVVQMAFLTIYDNRVHETGSSGLSVCLHFFFLDSVNFIGAAVFPYERLWYQVAFLRKQSMNIHIYL